MRPIYAWMFLALIACTVTGCATGSASRLTAALYRKSDSAAGRKDESEETKSETAAKSHNPFRKSDSQSAKNASQKSGDPSSGSKTAAKTETDGSRQQATATDDKAKATFPQATQQLIDSELADATPDEKAYWYDHLQTVDPGVIPQILQARRLSAQIAEQQSPSNETPSPKAPGTPWTTGDTPESAQVVAADGRQFPGARKDLNAALYPTDGMSMRQQIAQQGYETPAASLPGKTPYAVQRVSESSTLHPVPPATLSTNSSARSALSRLLPSSRGPAVATANSSSAVSLLPPTSSDRDASAPGQLESLISALESDLGNWSPGATEESQTEFIQRHVYLRLLYLMANHPERALTAIPGIEPADQEFWQQTLWAMTNYFDRDHIPSARDRASQTVAQLTTAAQRLREKADLQIRNLAFCQEITYFGNFARLPRDEFRPGDSALLYAEIENFKGELTIDGQYRTLLRSTVEILSPSGEVRWHKEFPANEDLCLNYRRDYFLNCQFAIDDRLPLGPHTLKLTVFDELSNKMVSQSINFVVR